LVLFRKSRNEIFSVAALISPVFKPALPGLKYKKKEQIGQIFKKMAL